MGLGLTVRYSAVGVGVNSEVQCWGYRAVLLFPVVGVVGQLIGAEVDVTRGGAVVLIVTARGWG